MTNKTVEEYVILMDEVELTSVYSTIQEWSHGGSTIGFRLSWNCREIGFGEADFYVKEGKSYCDDEAMSPEFIEAVLIKYARALTLTHK